MQLSNKDFQGHSVYISVVKWMLPSIFIGLVWQVVAGVLSDSLSDPFLVPFVTKTVLILAGFVWMGYWLNTKGPGNMFKKRAVLEAHMKEALDRYDYYDIGLSGAIAVDIKNKKLAIIDASECYPKLDKATKTIIGMDKVLSVNAYQPGRELVSYEQVVGVGFEGAGNAALANTIAGVEEIVGNQRINFMAAIKAGLVFEIDDIHNSKTLCGIPFREAETWLLLLRKINNGEVEHLSQPEIYPRKQVSLVDYLK